MISPERKRDKSALEKSAAFEHESPKSLTVMPCSRAAFEKSSGLVPVSTLQPPKGRIMPHNNAKTRMNHLNMQSATAPRLVRTAAVLGTNPSDAAVSLSLAVTEPPMVSPFSYWIPKCARLAPLEIPCLTALSVFTKLSSCFDRFASNRTHHRVRFCIFTDFRRQSHRHRCGQSGVERFR